MKKFNWGHGIIVAIALFMAFILYFVIKVQSDSKYDNDMVQKDYYVQDMKYSETLSKLRNTAALAEQPQIQNTAAGIQVAFPTAYADQIQQGLVSLYRPSNEHLDFSQPIDLSNASLLIPEQKLVGGLWDLSIEWEMNGQSYLYKERIHR